MKYNIALVDDHILIAKAIAGVIDNFPNYHVLYEVENGKALIDKFKNPKNIPDLVLLDITMPVMDGFEATRRWRNQEQVLSLRRIPIIALTANAMQGDEERCLAAGMDAHLAKPINLEALANVLAKWLAL